MTPLLKQNAPAKLLGGYWHNFANAAGVVPLADVPDAYDVVNIAFAVPAPGSTSDIRLTLVDPISEIDFADGIRMLQKRGKKVLLSIGGADATVQLKSREDTALFVTSVAGLVEKYGFDGIDIDFENQSLYLTEGDCNLFEPVSEVVINLITALRSLHSRFGPDFAVSLAPETLFVQQGFTRYGQYDPLADCRSGCALPVIASLRDILSWLCVQQYNSGPMKALDGNIYACGHREFHVAMADMLLRGFAVASGAAGSFFEPLEPERLLIGIPACREAGAGFLDAEAMQDVLDYIATGRGFGGAYRLQNFNGYPSLGGVMIWSINWDVHSGCVMSNRIRKYLDSAGVTRESLPILS
jgi:chitinase